MRMPGAGSTRERRLPMRTVAMSLLVVMALFVGMGLDRVMLEVTTASSNLSSASNYSIIDETYETIRSHYVLSNDISDEELVWGAAQGMVAALGDTNHSRFMNPEEAKAFNESSQGQFVGIGITVDTTGELPVVIAPMPGSPALEAGIEPGDTILEVDGTDLSTMPATDAVDLIRGEEGTQVTIKLQHQGASDTYEVTITRQKIDVNPVSYIMLPGDILWLRLDQFSSGATDYLREGLQWGLDNGMKGLVFDLRGNPGGLVVEAMGVAAQFLPDGTPLYQELDNTGAKKINRTVGSQGLYHDGPMVVIVDKNSASAAEITSSALEENGRAQLYGVTTAGTGTVLYPFDLSDGSMALIGIELFLTSNGSDIYKKGIVPENKVELGPDQTMQFPIKYTANGDTTMTQSTWDGMQDDQLKAAYEALGN